MFFSPKLNTVFASRWKAVSWSVGILITAYCSVPSADETDSAGKAPAGKHHHKQAGTKSPWALDKH